MFTSCIENSRSSVYCLDLAHYKTWIFYIQYSSAKQNGLATKIEIDDEDSLSLSCLEIKALAITNIARAAEFFLR